MDGVAAASSFILAGGASRRMGSDKALLLWRGKPLLQHTAELLQQSAGNCTIVAPAGRYESYGYPILVDQWPGEGPLGGILTALEQSTTDCNLIVAVDMPDLQAALLTALLDAARASGRTVVPSHPGGIEPLCAVYQRAALPGLRSFFERGGRRVKDALREIETEPFYVEMEILTSVNTPEQWEATRR